MDDEQTADYEQIWLLRTALIYHSRIYYYEAKSEITDGEFDEMLRDLQRLEDKWPDAVSPDSPTQKIQFPLKSGFRPRVPKLKLYVDGKWS